MLEAENLSKRFMATVALDNINLRVPKGLILVLGPNGSGKTTLLKIASGLLRPSKGWVRVLGESPGRVADRIIYLYEHMPVPWWLSGRDLYSYYARARAMSSMAGEVIEDYGVKEFWNGLMLTYSSGMLKKLYLALTFSVDADLYIVDEPFTLLDHSALRRTLEIIRVLRGMGKGFLVATHVLLEPLTRLCDSLVVLRNGRLLFALHRQGESYRVVGKARIYYRVRVRLGKLSEIAGIMGSALKARIVGGEAEITISDERLPQLLGRVGEALVEGIDIAETYVENLFR